MSPDIQRYYENRLTMFSSQGWKDLIEDVKQMLDSTNRLEGVTRQTLGFKQGEISIMNWIIQLEAVSKQAYADVSMGVPSGAHHRAHNEVRDEDDE